MIRRLVLDVLKPHKPDVAVFSEELSKVEGINGINISLLEVDREVENVKITMEGELDYDKIEVKIKDLGGSVHSIDEASSGEELIKEAETVHERRKRSGIRG